MINEGTIEEIKRLGEKLRRYRHIFIYQPIPSAIVRKDGIIIEVNKAVCEHIGLPKEKLEGMHFQEITHVEDAPKDIEQFTQLVEGKIEHYRFKKRYRDFKDDRYFKAILNVWNMGDDLILGNFYVA